VGVGGSGVTTTVMIAGVGLGVAVTTTTRGDPQADSPTSATGSTRNSIHSALFI
jgi:hypothetical protein